jgi:hypothetical protein
MQIHKKSQKPDKPHPAYVYEIAEQDDSIKYLVGWPGYRTSQGRSGLGYLETQAELAHMQGVMIRWLITGKFISHNPLYLLLMFLFGFFTGGLPLVLVLGELFNAANRALIFIVAPLFSPYVLIGILLVINVGISLLNTKAKSITGD